MREPTLADLTLERALHYQQHLQRRPPKATPLGRRATAGLSPYTIHQHGRALRSFSPAGCWRHGYLEGQPPSADFHPGRLPEREVEPLSPAEQQQRAGRDGSRHLCRRPRDAPIVLDPVGLRVCGPRNSAGSRSTGVDLETVARCGCGAVRAARTATWPWGCEPWRRCTSMSIAIGRLRRCRRWASRCS